MKLARLLPCAIVVALGVRAAAAVADTNSPAAKATASLFPLAPSIPLSVFADAPTLKDPFFPKSIRRNAQDQAQPVKSTTSASELAGLLTLNGISGPSNRRLAIINGRTMAIGESFEFNTPRGKIKVRCLEIRSASAVIGLGEEETKVEVKLRD